MSPHPDDLVYSAFSVLNHGLSLRIAVVLFNVSCFTKWGLKPKPLVSLLRTLEDKVALGLLGVKPVHVYLGDTTARRRPLTGGLELRLLEDSAPQRIYCPLGIGSHPDHLITRRVALEHWIKWGKQPEFYLYEDLPYAARLRETDELERGCVKALESCGNVTRMYQTLSQEQMMKKLRISRLYVSQNDQTKLLSKRAKEVGAEFGVEYAEKFYSLRP
jgi:LmbE family N-acetylglucosaminyl deacetylase